VWGIVGKPVIRWWVVQVARWLLAPLILGASGVAILASLGPGYGGEIRVVFFLPLVWACAWRIGLGPAIVTTAVLMTAMFTLIVLPRVEAGAATTADAVHLVFGTGLALVGASIIDQHRRTRFRLILSERDRDEQRHLERLIDLCQARAVIGRDGTYLKVNDAYAALLDKTPEQLVGTAAAESIHPEDRHVIAEARDQLARTGQAVIEFRALDKNGQPTYHRALIISLHDWGDGEEEFFCIRSDITELRDAQSNLRRREAMLRVLEENIPGGALVQSEQIEGPSGLELHFKYIGTGFQRVLGYDPQVLINNPDHLFRNLIHPDDQEQMWRAIQRSAQAWEPLDETVRVRAAWGQWRWIQVRSRPRREGDRVLRDGLILDVTEQIEANQARLETEQRFRQFMDQVPMGAWITDDHERFVFVNRYTARLHGVEDPESLVGRRTSDIAPPEIAAEWKVVSDQVRREGRVIQQVERGRQPDGTIFEGLVLKFPLTDAQGRTDNLVGGVGIDLTELKRTQAILERSRWASEQAMRARSDHLAQLSHEIRTPLTAILGNVDRLVESDIPRDEAERARQTLIRSGRHLSHLLANVLDFAKIEAGGLDIHWSDANPRAIVADVVMLTSHAAMEKGIRLAHLVEETVPETIRTDPLRVQQIVTNLVTNAIKYTPPGGEVTLRVIHRVAVSDPDTTKSEHLGHPPETETVFASFSTSIPSSRWETTTSEDSGAEPTVERGWVVVQVRDTGVGIAADQLPRVFEPFSQVAAERGSGRAPVGYGLGLHIARTLAHQLDGFIQVRSAPGRGSLFELWLPVSCHHQSPSFQAVSSPTTDSIVLPTSGHHADSPVQENCPNIIVNDHVSNLPSATLSREEDRADAPRILIAEDNDDIREILGYYVRRILPNVTITFAENGRTAWELLKRGRDGPSTFALALLDLQMPEMNGDEVARHVRCWEARFEDSTSDHHGSAHLAMIALTADARDEQRLQCLQAGFDDYLTKPITMTRLREAIQRVMPSLTQA